MKKITVILDGASEADYIHTSIPEIFTLDKIRTHTPANRQAESLCCILSLLGVAEKDMPHGRAYLEALAENLPCGKNDMAVRVNGVITENGVLVSSCEEKTCPREHTAFKLYPVGTYKNLAVLKNKANCIKEIKTFPPHENIGEKINDIMPFSTDEQVQSFFVFLVQNGFYPWGEAVYEKLSSFQKLSGKRAAMVCAAQIVRGIALAMDIYCPFISGATAETDTSLFAKAKATAELIREYDSVFVHINGADEASHRRDINEKRAFITRVQNELLLPLIQNVNCPCEIMLTSDHATLCENGAHSNEPVPEYIYVVRK